jgi:hypothetical protein
MEAHQGKGKGEKLLLQDMDIPLWTRPSSGTRVYTRGISRLLHEQQTENTNPQPWWTRSVNVTWPGRLRRRCWGTVTRYSILRATLVYTLTVPQSDRLETGAEMRKVTSSLRRTEGTSCRHTSNSNRQTQGLGYSWKGSVNSEGLVSVWDSSSHQSSGTSA